MQQLTIWDIPPLAGDTPLLFSNAQKAKKLKDLADGMTQEIESKKNPAIGQLRSTRRRAQIAASLFAEGERLELIQAWLYGMSEAALAGNLPTMLEGISSKTQLECLATTLKWNESDFERMFSENLYLDSKKKLKRANIVTAKQCIKAIAALKTLQAPKEIDGAEAITKQVKMLRQEAIWQGVCDFFPTPTNLIEQMIKLAELQPGMKTLEPHAGAGDICIHLRNGGVEPDCFEVSSILRESLQLQGFNLIGDDFLKAEPKPIYEKILANPPFSKGVDAKHIQHAYKWLRSGGRLVSISSCAYLHYESSKHRLFRNWLRRVNATVLDNTEGVFKQSDRPTNVRTQIVVINK